MSRFLAVGSVGIVLLFSAFGSAAQEPPKPAFDPRAAADGGLGMPTPYDKFVALGKLADGKINWAKAYRGTAVSLDTDAFKDPEVEIPLALGVRIADGVMAVQAKQAELLNQCASDIERLAKKMGIADADLKRARDVRTAANKGEWLQVFLDLGFFQQDIMKKIEKEPTRGTLMIVSGWMQGARYTAGLVLENYSEEGSNVLREPLLIKALQDKVEALPPGVRDRPAVAGLRKVLPEVFEIVNISRSGSISKEKVTRLQQLADSAVKLATQPGR